MRRHRWTGVTALGVALVVVGASCGTALAAEGTKAASGSRMLLPYQGAPPLVPHEVEARKAMCQDCHATGAQGAPITPHPTRTHFCIQCHVGQDQSVQLFVPTPERTRRR